MAAGNFVKWKLPALLWCLIVMILTSYPKLTVPSGAFNYMDKLAHLFVYFIIALLIIRALVKDGNKVKSDEVRKTIYYTGGFAIFDELHQIPIPGRSGEVFDVIADLLGVLLAIGLFPLLLKISSKRQLARKIRGDM